jgi:hypothetical protein
MNERTFKARILERVLEFFIVTGKRTSYPTCILIWDLQVLIAVDIKTEVFWHGTLCSMVKGYQHYGVTWRLHLKVNFYQTTRHHISEDWLLFKQDVFGRTNRLLSIHYKLHNIYTYIRCRRNVLPSSCLATAVSSSSVIPVFMYLSHCYRQFLEGGDTARRAHKPTFIFHNKENRLIEYVSYIV